MIVTITELPLNFSFEKCRLRQMQKWALRDICESHQVQCDIKNEVNAYVISKLLGIDCDAHRVNANDEGRIQPDVIIVFNLNKSPTLDKVQTIEAITDIGYSFLILEPTR